MMLQGVVARIIHGFCDVDTEEATVRCRFRGRLRRDVLDILPGDRVELAVLPDGAGVVERVLPRTTELHRPAVANVDTVAVVFSISEPDLNRLLLDRFLVQVEREGIRAVLCLNKIDLARGDDARARLREVVALYSSIGYEVVLASAKTGEGVDGLRVALGGRISVFAGRSGVGKSSLLNALQPELALRTGELSGKLRAGRHTTRHVELLKVGAASFVVDTPGFSYLGLVDLDERDLAATFPEMRDYLGRCKFASCLHHHEPACAVKDAVVAGRIDQGRYRHYTEFLEEIMEEGRTYRW